MGLLRAIQSAISPAIRKIPDATALTAARSGGAPAAGVTWDAATKSAATTLSDADLTAATTSGSNSVARTASIIDSGKVAIKFTANCEIPSNEEIEAGITAAEWGGDADGSPRTNGFRLTTAGYVNGVDIGRPVGDGESFFHLVDIDAGKGFVGNAQGFNGDPEAGTDPDYIFTPGRAFCIFGLMYSSSGESTTALTLDPTYSSGSYGSVNSLFHSPTAPGAPAITAVTDLGGMVQIDFDAPASNGGAAITDYVATSNPEGLTGNGSESPIFVSDLPPGDYTFTVHATNANGDSVESAPSDPVTVF